MSVPTKKDQERAKKILGLKKHLERPYDEFGRVCACCGEYKLWDSYPKATKTKVGRASTCSACKVSNRRSRGRNFKQEKYKASLHNKKLKKTEPHLLRGRRLRASLRKRGIKHEMYLGEIPTAEEIAEWLKSQEPLTCYYTGVPVDIFSMHVDHKRPLTRGGSNTLDNLCVTDSKINSAKGQMTEQEFKSLLELMSTWEDGGKYVLTRLRQGFMGRR